MSAKILLVGGAGYVGSVLAGELVERGFAVRVLDRLYYGDSGLRDVADRVEVVVQDMRKLSPEILEDVQAVINLGGLSNDPTAEYNPKANYAMNTLASTKLAEMCIEAGVRRYVLASSCSIYDCGVGNEAADLLQDETSVVDPHTAYAGSKRAAEKAILALASDSFCPVVLRKGTVYGFSPRMRYDLVVNTFVKDALQRGVITLHLGGEMWRPMVDVHDAARAYIACVQADDARVKGQIFNVSYRNFRISELALRVRETLRDMSIACDICSDYGYRTVRSYRVSAEKIENVLGVRPTVTVEAAVKDMVEKIRAYGYNDLESPRYYNISWMKLLEEASRVIAVTGSVFEA